MGTQVTNEAAGPTSAAETTYGIIDSDVHPLVPGNSMEPLLPYMDSSWRRRFELKGLHLGAVALTPRFAHPTGSVIRADAATERGPGGADREFMQSDLLDRHGIGCAILNNFQVAAMAVALAGPEESGVLCSAFNDYFLNEWVEEEPRFRYTLTVPTQDPEAAVAEIRRRGSHAGVAAVFLPLLNIRMGNRYYYPIYGAAQDAGLPIFVHFSGGDFIYQGAPAAMGLPETFAERYVDLGQIAVPNIASLVFSGVFERFPNLKFVFAEYGFTWLVPLLWRMDRVWRSARIEMPWVKKFPREYVEERIRLTTQPIDEPARVTDLERLMGMLSDRVLLFSTDYPHWDNDMPDHQVLHRLPSDQQRRIFELNAADVFRLS